MQKVKLIDLDPLPPAELDRVYRALLAACPLSNEQREVLRAAAIPDDAQGHYGTLGRDRRAIRDALCKEFPEDLLARVPGLVAADGRMAVNAPPALLVGVVNGDGLLVGMQARCVAPNGGKSYIWLSSASAGGVGSGSPAHVAPGQGGAIVVYITEGVKKADVCSVWTGATTIGLAGHSVQTDGLAQLDRFIERGTLAVVIALDEDSDQATAALVATSRQQLIIESLARGLAVRVARWDPHVAKGIDDLYLAGETPTISVVAAQISPDDPGRREGGRRLSRDEEAARYRCLKRLYYCVAPNKAGRSMTASDKLTLWGTWEAADLYPGTIISGGSTDVVPAQVCLSVMADRVGVSRGTVGKIVSHLAAAGLVTRTERRDDVGHMIVSVAPARQLGYNEVLPAAEHRVAEVARKRCTHCGSTDVVTRTTCMACGAVETGSSPCTQNVHLSIESTCTESVQGIDQKPCTESVHGVILEETVTPAPPPVPTVAVDDVWRCLCGGNGWIGSMAGGEPWCRCCQAVRVLPPGHPHLDRAMAFA